MIEQIQFLETLKILLTERNDPRRIRLFQVIEILKNITSYGEIRKYRNNLTTKDINTKLYKNFIQRMH